MALAALAILGHRSAHSLPMGPVIADPETCSRIYQDRYIIKQAQLNQNHKLIQHYAAETCIVKYV